MSNGGMLGLMPRTKRGLVVFFGALFMLSIALQYASAMAPKSAFALSGAVFTSNFDGTGIDLNIYDSKGAVYLTGGPCQGGSHLEDGTYYYQVTSPDGVLLSSDAISQRLITVSGGFITASSGHVTHDVACTNDPGITVQLLPYDDTPNSGGEYKLTVGVASQVAACDAFANDDFNFVKDCKQIDTKSDNYKVGANGDLKIVKTIQGGPDGASGSFPVSVDCGQAGTFTGTIVFPTPGFITIHDIEAGAECTVTEGTKPAPPAGFAYGAATYTGNPATIGDDTTVTVGVVNHLVQLTGSLKITKAIPDVPEGYEGSFGVHVTCDKGGPFDATIDFPDPGFVTIDDIPAGASCVVIETTKSAPPAGFQFGGANINGPVTIGADQTAEITVTNPLIELQGTPVLTIDKSNDAPTAAAGGSKPGDTVTYTLDYTVANGPVHNGIITDVLPAGLTYVSGSASSDAQFTFIDFNVTTPGALTWKAATVSANGSLTYKVTVDADAADEDQPLVNTATIDSDETAPSSDTSNVFVPAPVLAETSVPTAPRSDIGNGPESTASGGSMLLILLALAGIALAVVFVAPTPASIRKRNR